MENYKKAFESAQQEIQEKEVIHLKNIVKDLLQKKQDLEEEKRTVEKKIGAIKQTIDDFKAGRLDKVKELTEKDETAKQVIPFKIVIVNKNNYAQPWKWIYRVEPQYYYHNSLVINSSTFPLNNSIQCGSTNLNATCASGTGSNFATFTSGTYTTSNGIINL